MGSTSPPLAPPRGCSLVEQHLTLKPAHPRKLKSTVPRKLVDVVLNTLSVDPAARYQAMEAMADATRAALHSTMMESTRQYGDPGGLDITGPKPPRR